MHVSIGISAVYEQMTYFNILCVAYVLMLSLIVVVFMYQTIVNIELIPFSGDSICSFRKIAGFSTWTEA